MKIDLDEEGIEEVEEVEELEEDAGGAGGGQKDKGAEGADDKDGKKKPDEEPPVDRAEFKRVQKELKAERARAKESSDAARYWSEQAKQGARKAEAKPEPDEIEEIDVVNELTANGAKGLDKVLRTLGYAKQSDVRQEISATRTQISAETAVLSKYPDLADESSPLFAKTAEIYNQLRSDSHMAKSPRLMEIAARTASAELALGAGRGQRRGQARSDDDEGGGRETDDDRAARIARQSGDRGRRESRKDSESDELTSLQKRMIQNFQNAGAKITEDGYKKRAQSGTIQMGGIRGARRAA